MALKILVVDDEPDLEVLILQHFRQKIRTREYAFWFAGNGHEALETLDREEGIELVLTDINMPRMDGLTLLSSLRERETPLKAVVVSAYGDMDNIRTAMNRGAFDFLVKPIDLTDLDITISRAAEEVATMREAVQTRERLVALNRELNVASQIQQSMLPQAFDPFSGLHEVDIFARMLPARAVGGDFFDFFVLEPQRLGLVIGDVSGKGVPAALLMTLTLTLVKSIAKTGLSTSECVAHTNRILSEDNEAQRFVTLFYGIMDVSTGALEFCNAGHNPPLWLKAGGGMVELDSAAGIVLGVRKEAGYESGEVTLAPGDALFLYTDGVTEAMNSERALYSESRLNRILGDAPSPADELIAWVMDDVESFAGPVERHDDITAMAVRFRAQR